LAAVAVAVQLLLLVMQENLEDQVEVEAMVLLQRQVLSEQGRLDKAILVGRVQLVIIMEVGVEVVQEQLVDLAELVVLVQAETDHPLQ
jgi:hypothetical protein